MVELRPHIAKVNMQGGESVFNQNTGEYEIQPTVDLEFPCRVSPNGGAQKIKNQDGNEVVYSFMVHADKDLPKIPYGSGIRIFKGSELVATGKVLGSFSNSMNLRIWL